TCRFETRLTATRAGNYTLHLQVTGAHKVRTTAHATVAVLAADMRLRVAVPPSASVGQVFDCTVDLSNLGDAPVAALQAAMVLPEGLDHVSSPGAAFDPENRCLTWTVNTIEPGESRQQTVTVAARVAGKIDLRVDAWDRNGSAVSAVNEVLV